MSETRTARSRPRRRTIVLVGLATLVLAFGAYLYASSVVYDAISLTAADCGGRWQTNTPAAFTSPGIDTTPYLMSKFEDVRFASRDPGIEISAWYVPAETLAPGPAVVLVHGHDSCRREDRILLAAGMLHRAGIAALLVDLRNHGDSTVVNGRFAGGTREYRDALAGWDWLVNTRGFAPGSGRAVRAVARRGDRPHRDRRRAPGRGRLGRQQLRRPGPGHPGRAGPERLSDLRSVWRLRDGLAALRGRPAQPESARGSRQAGGRPIFITHGTADTRLSPAYAADLAAAVRAHGGSVDPWMVAGAEHTQAIVLQPAEYDRRLVTFFQGALAGTGS